MAEALNLRQHYDVVRVIARLNVGGPALHVMHLTERLSDRYPTLLVTGSVDNGEADMLEDARRRGIPVYQIPELGRAVRAGDDVVAYRKLFRVLRTVRPRILHTHTAKAGTLGRMAGVLARVPALVHTFHGHVFHGYFNRPVTHGILAVERTLAYATDRIVAISEIQAADLTTRYHVCRPDRVRVIPLGLDLGPFLNAQHAGERASFRQELGIGEQAVVTIVGRLAPIKNHDLFLDAAARLGSRRDNIVFVVVGDGSEMARLQQRTAELGITDRVRYVGWRYDLPRVYAGSDVVVLTSRNEGTPVCLIEALAAGRPVVATNVGGVADVLEHGRAGYLVPDNAPDALAEQIGYVLDHPAESAGRAAAGAHSVAQRYSVQRLCSDTINLYDELSRARTRRN